MNLSENERKCDFEDKVFDEVIEQTIKSLTIQSTEEESDVKVCFNCELNVELVEHNCLYSLKSELFDQKNTFKKVIMRIKSLWINETKDLFNKLKDCEKTRKSLKRENSLLNTKLIKQKLMFENGFKAMKEEIQLLKNTINELEVNNQMKSNTTNSCNETDCEMNDSNDSIQVIHETISYNNINRNENLIINNSNNNNSNFWRPFEIEPNVNRNEEKNEFNFYNSEDQLSKPSPIYTFNLNAEDSDSITTGTADLDQTKQSICSKTIFTNHLCGNTLLNTNSYSTEEKSLETNETLSTNKKKLELRQKSSTNRSRTKESTEKNVLKCEFNGCTKTFKFRSALVNHRLVHSEERKYNCNICGKRYKQLSGLYSHESSKHSLNKSKKYFCDYCGDSFVDHRNMKIHEYNQHKCVETSIKSDESEGQKKKVYLQLRTD